MKQWTIDHGRTRPTDETLDPRLAEVLEYLMDEGYEQKEIMEAIAGITRGDLAYVTKHRGHRKHSYYWESW